MTRVLILGAGRMGTAIATPLVDRGHDVRLVGTHLDDAPIDALRSTRIHPGLGVPAPERLRCFTFAELDPASRDVEAVVVGVSSVGVRWAVAVLSDILRPGIAVAMVTKGLEWDGSRLATMPEVFLSPLPDRVRASLEPVAISGPCLAAELAARAETSVVVSGRDLDSAKWWANLARTSYYHLVPSDDPRGEQLAAALKNAYVIALGMVVGARENDGGGPRADLGDAAASTAGPLGGRRHGASSTLGFNAEAAVFTQAAHEMALLIELAGGGRDAVLGPSGVGDLLVTTHGRNHALGLLLGRGLSLATALDRLAGVSLEGVEVLRELERAIPALEAAGKLARADLPLGRYLVDVMAGGQPAGIPFAHFGR